MLHTVNKSPMSSTLLEQSISFADKGDAILLYEDAVYAALAGSEYGKKLEGYTKEYEFYALSADTKARGLDKLVSGVKVVDYTGFVELVEKHKVNNCL